MKNYISKLLALQNRHKEKELRIKCKQGVFRIDLKPENLRLWSETISNHQKPCNLLLACDSDKVDLKASRLTWVVGSAIRAANIDSPNGAYEILQCLGVPAELAAIAKDNCPGLGTINWAFYFDRNNSLTASPAMILYNEK